MSMKELVEQIGLPVANPQVIPEQWVKEEGGEEYIKTTWEDDELHLIGQMLFEFVLPKDVKDDLIKSAYETGRDASHVADDFIKIIIQMMINDLSIHVIPEMHAKIVKAITQ